jgi:hypothetical protein
MLYKLYSMSFYEPEDDEMRNVNTEGFKTGKKIL